MNFYKHYIGDFQRDTGHLSLTERGAYLSLIHHYYATEKPLPKELDSLCRIAGAVTKTERDAVKAVIVFFELVESGLMHSRIEAEIEKAGDISTTNRDIALKREAKRRATKTASIEHETITKRAESVSRTVARSEHEQSTSQTPDSRTIKTRGAHTLESDVVEPETASAAPPAYEQLATQLQKAGVTITSSHPNVIAWVGRGVTGKQAADAIAIARQRKPDGPIPANYLVPIIEEILNPPAASTAKTSGAWRFSDEATLAKGRELGLEPHVGELMEPYRQRISIEIERRKAEA